MEVVAQTDQYPDASDQEKLKSHMEVEKLIKDTSSSSNPPKNEHTADRKPENGEGQSGIITEKV